MVSLASFLNIHVGFCTGLIVNAQDSIAGTRHMFLCKCIYATERRYIDGA